MSRDRSRPQFFAVLLAALALIMAPVLATAPVQAEVDCTPTLELRGLSSQIVNEVRHPNEVILDGGSPRELYFYGGVTDHCPGDGWFDDGTQIQSMLGNVTLPDGRTDRNAGFCCFNEEPGFYEGGATFDGDRYKDFSVLGSSTLTVWAYDGTHSWIVSPAVAFQIRRAMRFPLFNASPEPVRKGSPVKVSGYLTRLVYYASGEAKYIPYAGKRVNVYFKRFDQTTFHYIAPTATTSIGYFTKNIVATVDGCWNVRTADTDYYAGRQARVTGDCVDVR